MTPEMSEDAGIHIRSPYRPLPLSAKKALADAVASANFPTDETRLAIVSEMPPPDVLKEYELTVEDTAVPTEIWESDTGEQICVFPDRIEMDGSEVGLPREEILSKLQNQERFTQCAEGE